MEIETKPVLDFRPDRLSAEELARIPVVGVIRDEVILDRRPDQDEQRQT